MAGVMNDEHLCKALKRLSYVSSPAYISFLYHLLRADNDPLFEEDFTMLNMFYYSLYQDTPDDIGFENPMDFVQALREHAEGYKEFLDYLSIRYAEQKPLKNKIDLGYDCVLDLYSRYSRNEILAALDYWNWSKRPAMREGVIYLADKKTDLFFVTLKKTEDEYSSTTTYEDYFIDKEQFHWQSQNSTPDTSSVGQRYINHAEMGTQVLLFVREQKIKEGKSVPYVFLGKVSYVKHEGSKPMNIIWKLESPVPDEIYAELYVDRSKSSDESGIESPGKSIKKVQTSIPDYYVEEGFHLPFSIEKSESFNIGEEAREVIEFEVKIIKDKDTLSVSAQNAVSLIKKNFLGYTIETRSTLLSQELGLSDKVLATRESLKNIQQLTISPFDSTILRLTNYCTFHSLSLALEMILGCGWEDCPAYDVLPAESVWKYSFDKSSLQSSVVEELPEEAKVVEVGKVGTEEGEEAKVVEVGKVETEEEEEVDMHSSDASTECPDELSNVVRVEVKIVKKNDHTLDIYAGNAVATIIKSIFGYTIVDQCTILNQDLGLSENVASLRKSLKSNESLLTCSSDATLLRLGHNYTCPTLPIALEMITGCGRDDCPRFDALPAKSVWIYSFDQAGETSPNVMRSTKIVGDKVERREENISLPKETKLESPSSEDDLPIMRDGDSEKINLDTGFENPPVNIEMGPDEGKQSPTADSNNESSSSLLSNYSISLDGELLLIKSEEASAKVKKEDGRYFLLQGSTFNNSLRTLANHDSLKQKQKLIFEGYLTPITISLWELESFDPAYDDLHTIVEMVVGFPCDPNEVLTKESELFGRKEGEFKEEKPALNVESSEIIDSIKTPEFSSIYSWDLVGVSATKHVDKSVINYNGSGVPLEICPFFKAESLNPGDKILLTLQYAGQNFAGHIIKEQIIPGVKSPRTRIFWDKDLGDIIREYFKEACGDCIIKFYKTENNKNSYVLDFFIIDSSLLLDEVNQRDSLVKITKKYSYNPILNIEFGKISARVTYYIKDNYYILLFASEISCVVVPPTKLGEPDKRILIQKEKLIHKPKDSRLLKVDQSIRYSSLNEVLSSIFGIQCSAPYPNPLALPVKGMYRLPNLALVEDSTTTRQTKTTAPLIKVESIENKPVEGREESISYVGIKKGENIKDVTSFVADTSKLIDNPNKNVSLVNEARQLSPSYYYLKSKSERSVFVLPKLHYSNDDQLLLTILAQTFPNGIDIKNPFQMRKLISLYDNAAPSEKINHITSDMSLISSKIMNIAIQCKDHIWISPESLNISDELLTKIITQIIDYLNNGEITVCFDIIYQQYDSELLSTKVYNSLTLENLISRYLKKGYYYYGDYVSKLKNDQWQKALSRKIILALQSYGEPILYNELCGDLPHVPIEAIDKCLRLPEVIGGGKSRCYVHINCLDITPDDVKVLHDLITSNLKDDIITTAHIFELFREVNPEFFEKNKNIDHRSLINIAEFFFKDEFFYKQGFISKRRDQNFSATEKVIKYLCNLPEFTYQDMETYCKENYYNVAAINVLGPILKEYKYLRLDEDRFVSNTNLPIPRETLNAIERHLIDELQSEYVCSDNITNYLSYPYIGTNRCTPYLLESVVRLYGKYMSRPLKVIDYFSGGKQPRGIIVLRASKFQSHEDVIVDVLQRRHREQPFENSKEAIAYLKEQKYIVKELAGIVTLYQKVTST